MVRRGFRMVSLSWASPCGSLARRSAWLHSALLCYGVQKFDKGEDCAIHALDFRIFRFDDVVFVRSVRAASVAEAEWAGCQMQRLAGEDVTGPRSSAARQNNRVDPAFAV